MEINGYCPDMENCPGRGNGTCVICPMQRGVSSTAKMEENAIPQGVKVEHGDMTLKLPEASKAYYMERFMKAI